MLALSETLKFLQTPTNSLIWNQPPSLSWYASHTNWFPLCTCIRPQDTNNQMQLSVMTYSGRKRLELWREGKKSLLSSRLLRLSCSLNVSGRELKIVAMPVGGGGNMRELKHMHAHTLCLQCPMGAHMGSLFKDCNLECFQPQGPALFHVTNIEWLKVSKWRGMLSETMKADPLLKLFSTSFDRLASTATGRRYSQPQSVNESY